MSRGEAQRLFSEANRLWFEEGRTYAALAKYREAARHDPDNPAIAHQIGLALWGLGQPEEASRHFLRVEELAAAAGVPGRELAAVVSARPSMPPPAPASLPPGDLDLDVLESRDLSNAMWRAVAEAAAAREMYALAAQAIERSHEYTAFELVEDSRDLERRGHVLRSLLLDVNTQSTKGSGQSSVRRPTSSRDEDPTATAGPPVTADAIAPPVLPTAGPTGPLRLNIVADPEITRVDEKVSLRVILTNVSAQPVAVNRRFLLNHPDAPPGYGELVLHVAGPPGYENLTRFSVRAGRPGADHFDVLMPGESATGSHPLRDYESLHDAGDYRVAVTYHNDVESSVGDLDLFVGAVTSRTIMLKRVPR